MFLAVLSAQGQPSRQQQGKGNGHRTEQRGRGQGQFHAPGKSKPGNVNPSRPGGHFQGKPHSGQMMPPGKGPDNKSVEERRRPRRQRTEEHYDIPMRDYREDMGRGQRRRSHWNKTYCVKDWQELWNGCHVRISNGRVSVLTMAGDGVVRGDEVILLPSGYYMVRSNDRWRIYDPAGVTTSISGEEIIAWPNGLFCVRLGDFWNVYDSYGDRVGNAWGDHVELMDNGLICCYRSGMYFYYDRQGNERK